MIRHYFIFGDLELNMKNRIISGLAAVLLGLLMTLGPQFLFKVCGAHDDSFPRCHWTARAEICTGILIAAAGFCLFVFSNPKTRLGLTIGIFTTGIISAIIPFEQFIGLCKSPEMACRRGTFPFLIALSALVLAGSVINMIYLERKSKS